MNENRALVWLSPLLQSDDVHPKHSFKERLSDGLLPEGTFQG